MSTKKRPVQPGGRRVHRKGAGKLRVNNSTRKDEIDDLVEHRVLGQDHDSRHWAPRVDEIDAFGSVTIYDAEGRITRVIAIDALRRPWQERQGNTWNNCLFPKRISDRV